MPTVEQLEEYLADLREHRDRGVARVRFPDDSSIDYSPDPERAAAEAALEHRIARLKGTAVHTVRVSSTKGLSE